MADGPDLSPGELEIMDVLWRRGCASVREIQAALEPTKRLSRNAIGTVLSRMKQKGYVDAREKNFAWEFRPLITHDQVVRCKLDYLVNRLFGGDVLPLLSYAADSGKLNPEQAAVLVEIAVSARR